MSTDTGASFWYELVAPHPAEAALGTAIAVFVAQHFGLPGLAIRWVRELPAPAGLLVRAFNRTLRACGEQPASEDPILRPVAVDGLAVGSLVSADTPVIIVRAGLDMMRLAETIGHEAAHAWQAREYPEVWAAVSREDLERSAERLGLAAASAWWGHIETDRTARVLSVAWQRARDERGRAVCGLW